MNIDVFNELNATKKEVVSAGTIKNGHKVMRNIYCNNGEGSDSENFSFKYKEKITFLEKYDKNNKRKEIKTKANKTAICIGYNPAAANDELDMTNKRLIDLLWDEYDGYLLVNLFPQITDKKDECDLDLADNLEFSKVVENILKNNNEDIILFWGRTTVIPQGIYEAIIYRLTSPQHDQGKKRLRMTVHGIYGFTHPASNAGISLQNVDVGNIIETYKIV